MCHSVAWPLESPEESGLIVVLDSRRSAVAVTAVAAAGVGLALAVELVAEHAPVAEPVPAADSELGAVPVAVADVELAPAAVELDVGQRRRQLLVAAAAAVVAVVA